MQISTPLSMLKRRLSSSVTKKLEITNYFNQPYMRGTGFAYSENMIVAVGNADNIKSGLCWSTDGGLSWYPSSNYKTFDPISVAYSPELRRWVAVGWKSSTIIYSDDGKTWNPSQDFFNSNSGGVGRKVEFGNGRFVTTGTLPYGIGVAWSEDGLTWTASQLPNNYTTISPTSIHYSSEQNKWVMLAYGNSSNNGNINYGSTIFYSTNNGTSFTPATDFFEGSNGEGYGTKVYYGNGKWIAIGANHDSNSTKSMCYSTNGITWTNSNQILDYPIDIVYGNGIWIVSGFSGGWTKYSLDNGITWLVGKTVISAEGNTIFIPWMNKFYVFGEIDGKSGFFVSDDGKEWSSRLQATLPGISAKYLNLYLSL